MFSRAAKSIVKTIGQQKFHAGEENIKLAMVGGAGEIGRSLSQMLKQTSKLDVLALYDAAALNKRYVSPIKPKTFSDGQPNTGSRMLKMLEKSRASKGDYLPTHQETEELVESLRRLPIAEECAMSQAPKPAIGSQLRATPGTQTRYQLPGNAIEGAGKKGELRLGEPDCGEGPPDWPRKSPCHPPKGPCKPMGPPGYPSKPKPEKKPFCVKCPPKKPCKTKKCCN